MTDNARRDFKSESTSQSDESYDGSIDADIFTNSIQTTLSEDSDMRAPIVKRDELEFLEFIASGSFGDVYSGTCRQKKVALKRLPPPEDDDDIKSILSEMKIFIHLRHPNVVLFMGVCFEDPENLIIVQELMSCDLFTYLKKNPVSLVQKVFIAKQVAEGMNWLHGGTPAILHSDLKPENILMDRDGTAKLCDFGLSVITRTNLIANEGIIGTPLYMSPEALLGDFVGKASDVYSFAIVIWAMINVEIPLSHISTFDELVDYVVHKKKRPRIKDIEKKQPELADLMHRMWSQKPYDRPQFPTILEELKRLIPKVGLEGDEGAEEFWNERFSGEISVPYEQFEKEFCDYLNIEISEGDDESIMQSKTKLLFLKDVLFCNDNEPVKIWKFAKCFHWFGKFEDENGNLLDKIYEIFLHPWFFGTMSSKEAHTKLQFSESGTFLVRMNYSDNSKQEPFRISAKGDTAPVHYKVKNRKTFYEVSKSKCPPAIDKVISTVQKKFNLINPAEGRSKYDSFFCNFDIIYQYVVQSSEEDSDF